MISTRDRGLVLAPKEIWSPEHKFKVHGRLDSDYSTNPDDCRSISGGRAFVDNVPIVFRSAMQNFVMLSVIEAKIAAGVMVTQDMLYIYQSLESLKFKVKSPMVLEMDNSGAVDIANSWSDGGRTRQVDVRNYFLHELKDWGLLAIKPIPEDANNADIFTKNVTAAIFNHRIPMYVGVDKYMDQT